MQLELNNLRKTYLLPAPLLHRRGQGAIEDLHTPLLSFSLLYHSPGGQKKYKKKAANAAHAKPGFSLLRGSR